MSAGEGALDGALIWGVKASLVGYVRGMADGRVEATDGAEAVEGGFRFPRAADARPGQLVFRGAVTLTAHGGMLRVVIADPALVETGDGWAIEIAGPDASEPGEPAGEPARLRFATVAAFDGDRASGTALAKDGSDLFFFGPYTQGTPLDDPLVAA